MTFCPQFDALAQSAAAGGPREAHALDVHAAACAACAAEAVLADDASPLADLLAPLGAEVCPPAVVTAALREARTSVRPPARPPARAARSYGRLRLASLAFGVTLVAGLGLRMAAGGPADVAVDLTDAPALDVATTETYARPVELATASTAEAVKPAPPVKPPPADASASYVAAAPTPRLQPTLASATISPPDPEPTAADSAAAVDGLRLALSVLHDARREGLAAAASELGRPQVALATSIPDLP